MNKKVLFIIAVVASAALTAHANLVTNPGFETGTFSGWTQFGDTSFTGVAAGAPYAHSGTFGAYFGPTGGDGGINQTIATIAGFSYTVDFWLSNDDSQGNNHMSASFAGVNLLTLVNAPPFAYTHYTMNVTATSSSSLLNFTFYNPPAYYYLDDVAVNVVPEPGTLGLIALGALGLVGALRKRLLV
jgi:hypothetical protein